MNSYIKGAVVKCTVSGITEYGIFVTADDNFTGLIHISEISNKFINNINELVIIGDVIFARIIDVDSSSLKLKLSIKNIDYKVDGKRIRKPIVEKGSGFSCLESNLPIFIEEKLKEIEENSFKL